MTRVPWADRPIVRAEWCTCPQDDEGERERWFIEKRDGDGRLMSRTYTYMVDPKCPLHGEDAQPAPY
jgi:hypothetical protein